MASIVFTQQQLRQIAVFYAHKQFVEPNVVANADLNQLKDAVNAMATSISIGGGTVSYNVSFSPPLSFVMTTAQQAALLGYICNVAMGLALV